MTQGCCGNGACGYSGYGYGGCANGSCGPTCGGYAYGPTYGDGSYGVGQLPILDASQQGHAAAVGTPTTPAQAAAPSFQAPMPAPKAGPTTYIPGLQSSALPVPPATVQLAGYHPPSNRVMAPLANAFNGN